MFISFDGFWLTVLAKSGENILPILQKNVRTNFVKNAYLNHSKYLSKELIVWVIKKSYFEIIEWLDVHDDVK